MRSTRSWERRKGASVLQILCRSVSVRVCALGFMKCADELKCAETISGERLNTPSTIFEDLEFLLFFLLVFFSFFHHLNEEAGFTVFTNKLFIFSGVQFSSAK